MHHKSAIIVGAGPAGLTAALEFCTRTDIHPIVLEKSDVVGGLARTVNYKGNRIDLGGHRFFSKSDRVVEWWLRILPLQATGSREELLTYQNQSRTISTPREGPDPDLEDRVMLIRPRLSRIYFRRKFFDYPITLSLDALRNLGMLRVLRIGASYLRAVLFPRRERSLEDFFINRFGRELYRTFFKSYTEKVWGVPCDQISAEWGAQRVKGLSISTALRNAARRLRRNPAAHGAAGERTETSLIQKFMYPKYGPGQMWEEVARLVRRDGGEILTGWSVERIEQAGNRRITAFWARHSASGELRRFAGDYFFSTMPVKDLVGAMTPEAPSGIRTIAAGLVYRDFIIVGVLSERLKPAASGQAAQMNDNWIYIHEPAVLAGRLQVFNNWSPYLIRDPSKTWIGLEYFCNDRDPLWRSSDEEMIALAKRELASMNLVEPADCLDATVIRMPKAYPSYFGSYDQFPRIIEWADRFENLFLIGRNGMHRYNNQDHSMLAAMTAVDNILAGVASRENLWSLNTEMEHHEEPRAAAAQAVR